MNSYDFDKTVFYPDSSFCFVRYCLVHHPLAVISSAPKILYIFIKRLFKKADTKALKESSFGFLKKIEDVDGEVRRFWEKNSGRMQSWYLKQKRDDDIIISASPEFLLKPMTDKLNVRLIGTRMDKKTGKIIGSNCHDYEKVVRLRDTCPEAEIDEFYSDSLSDSPMAEIAEKAFLVKKGDLSPWPEK